LNGDYQIRRQAAVQDKQPRGGMAIERVAFVRADNPPSPEAKTSLDNLLTRWLVRAYLQKHGSKPEVKEAT